VRTGYSQVSRRRKQAYRARHLMRGYSSLLRRIYRRVEMEE
jgi:hypothetical protein